LRIIEEDTSIETIEIEIMDKMLVAPALAMIQNKQIVIPKSIVLDPGWFDRNRTKFKD